MGYWGLTVHMCTHLQACRTAMPSNYPLPHKQQKKMLLLFVGWKPCMFANTYLDSPQEPIPKAQSKTPTPKPPYILYNYIYEQKKESIKNTFLGKKYSLGLLGLVLYYYIDLFIVTETPHMDHLRCLASRWIVPVDK